MPVKNYLERMSMHVSGDRLAGSPEKRETEKMTLVQTPAV